MKWAYQLNYNYILKTFIDIYEDLQYVHKARSFPYEAVCMQSIIMFIIPN